MKVARLFRTPRFRGSSHWKVLVLCVFFALGILLGRIVHSAAAASDDGQLREYLLAFTNLTAQPEDMTGAVLSVLITYFRYPLMVFLCGLMAAGVVLIPTLFAVQGFFLSFAVHSFASALGRSGVMLAAAAFGVRCLFALPCTLFLAMHALSGSVQLLQIRADGRKKERNGQFSTSLMRLAACALILLIGVVVELSLVPKLLQLALTNIT